MSNSRLVYSTDQGRIKPEKEQKTREPGDGVIRIRKETKGRGGKGVSIITGFDLSDDDLKTLAKKLKQLCSTGGTVKDGTIEIQGDHRQKLMEHLKKLGHTVKLSGG